MNKSQVASAMSAGRSGRCDGKIANVTISVAHPVLSVVRL